jgi:hypothetical protein
MLAASCPTHPASCQPSCAPARFGLPALHACATAANYVDAAR